MYVFFQASSVEMSSDLSETRLMWLTTPTGCGTAAAGSDGSGEATAEGSCGTNAASAAKASVVIMAACARPLLEQRFDLIAVGIGESPENLLCSRANYCNVV